MKRLSVLLVMVVVGGTWGCGFGGGSGGGGSSVAPIGSGPPGPVVSGSYLPSLVTRSSSYNWSTIYTPNQAAGGAITAMEVAAPSTAVWCGISPLGRVDYVTGMGQTAEASFVFDVSGFAVLGSNVYASTSNTIANRAGAVYQRDPVSAMWSLSLDGTLKECVPVAYLQNIFAFQGENDGRSATVSVLTTATNSWAEVAHLGSMVPASAVAYNGEMYCGGRSNNSAGGPAKLFHGNGSSFSEIKVPQPVFMGQIASVQALAVANNTLFVGVEIRDAVSGTTLGGNLYYLDTKGLISLNQMQGDAPIALAPADGTIYAGTRNGKLLWLDEKGKWNAEAGLPTNLGVTAVIWDGAELEVGIRSNAGAQLLKRTATGTGPTPPPPSGGFSFASITPNSGPPAGGTNVTIMGNGFATVTVVTVGGTPLANFKAVSDTTITGTTPPGTAGAADLVITSMSKGPLTVKGAFTYVAALSFATDVMPIFQQNCVISGCHNGNGFTISPLTSLLNGKSGGGTPYVVKGNANASWLAMKVDSSVGAGNATMAVHLSATQAKTIEAWINGGANP